jgi:hypothetical protein
MTQTTKSSLSVQELVALIDNPKRHSLKKRREPVIDRQEVKKHMRLQWKGNHIFIQIQVFAVYSFRKFQSSGLKCLMSGIWKESTWRSAATRHLKVKILLERFQTVSI